MKIETERFEAWLFAQPDNRTYSYTAIYDCLISKFIKETTNITEFWCGLTEGHYYPPAKQVKWWQFWRPVTNAMRMRVDILIPEQINAVANGQGWTFGDAKKRYLKIFSSPQSSYEYDSRTNHCPVPACN